MKILQFCNKPPFPAADGGAIAMGNMTRCLLRNGYDVTVLSMVSYKHAATESDWPEDLKGKIHLHFANVDLRLKRWDAFLNLFSSESYHVQRFYSPEVAGKLKSLLEKEKFDVIQMETIFPMVYHTLIRKHSNARIVLRLHNIEHEVWSTTAKEERNVLRKFYMGLLATRLKRFEIEVIKNADGIITISESDYKKIKSLTVKPLSNIPLGIDLAKYPVSRIPNNPPKLFHLGAMDWIPNQIGMKWFLDKVWPELSKKFPELEFHIAGRKMPKEFFERKSTRLIVNGEVEDAVEYMSSKDIMVVSLLSGSGLRVKIIEGLALGRAIISTSVGAAGIDYIEGENILIANTPEEFVTKISACINNPGLVKRIADNARKLAETKYSLEAVTGCLKKYYEELA